MKKDSEKPSPEAKALSLFLMTHKSTSPSHKEKAKRINRLWDLVVLDKFSKSEYNDEVLTMLESYGGYTEVVEKTVKFYVDKTGEWKLVGDDKYCLDAKKVADRLLNN